MYLSISRVARTHDHHAHHLQGKFGLDYDDPVAVNEVIPHDWWLADESCKYILSVLVHKDNKDISTKPTKQPPGPTREVVREKKKKETAKERSAAKEERPITVVQPDGTFVLEKYGDVDHQSSRMNLYNLNFWMVILIPFLTQPPHERTLTGRGSRVYPNVGAAGCTLTSGQPGVP